MKITLDLPEIILLQTLQKGKLGVDVNRRDLLPALEEAGLIEDVGINCFYTTKLGNKVLSEHLPIGSDRIKNDHLLGYRR